MGLLAVLLAAALWKVWHPGFRWFRVLLSVGVAGWLVLNFANVDALVGKKARVTAEIDNDEARGTAMVSGQEWTARSADGSRIPRDTMVQIQAVSGVKLIVSKCKEE